MPEISKASYRVRKKKKKLKESLSPKQSCHRRHTGKWEQPVNPHFGILRAQPNLLLLPSKFLNHLRNNSGTRPALLSPAVRNGLEPLVAFKMPDNSSRH